MNNFINPEEDIITPDAKSYLNNVFNIISGLTPEEKIKALEGINTDNSIKLEAFRIGILKDERFILRGVHLLDILINCGCIFKDAKTNEYYLVAEYSELFEAIFEEITLNYGSETQIRLMDELLIKYLIDNKRSRFARFIGQKESERVDNINTVYTDLKAAKLLPPEHERNNHSREYDVVFACKLFENSLFQREDMYAELNKFSVLGVKYNDRTTEDVLKVLLTNKDIYMNLMVKVEKLSKSKLYDVGISKLTRIITVLRYLDTVDGKSHPIYQQLLINLKKSFEATLSEVMQNFSKDFEVQSIIKILSRDYGFIKASWERYSNSNNNNRESTLDDLRAAVS